MITLHNKHFFNNFTQLSFSKTFSSTLCYFRALTIYYYFFNTVYHAFFAPLSSPRPVLCHHSTPRRYSPSRNQTGKQINKQMNPKQKKQHQNVSKTKVSKQSNMKFKKNQKNNIEFALCWPSTPGYCVSP